jgi:hypothetical protein
VGEHLVAVLQLNAKHRIGQWFDHTTLNLYGTVFLGHILRDPDICWLCARLAQQSLRLQNVSR